MEEHLDCGSRLMKEVLLRGQLPALAFCKSGTQVALQFGCQPAARRAPAEVAAFPHVPPNGVQVSESRIQRFGALVVARDERWDENVRGNGRRNVAAIGLGGQHMLRSCVC